MRTLLLSKRWLLIFTCAAITPTHLIAKEEPKTLAQSKIIKTEKYSEVKEHVKNVTTDTLVIFDIDDTLLTSDTFFGSDHWYEWQKNLDVKHPDFVPCKFDVTAINYEMGSQHPVEPETVKIVNSVTADKMYLTARNPAYRGATERELKKAKYQFPESIVGKDHPSKSRDGIIFSLYDTDQQREADVSYWKGIYMVSGLRKGDALVALLQKLELSNKYKNVILVDDGETNIDTMETAMLKSGINYVGIRYLRIAKALPIYKEMAETSHASWAAMKQFMDQTFPNRATRFDREDCHY